MSTLAADMRGFVSRQYRGTRLLRTAARGPATQATRRHPDAADQTLPDWPHRIGHRKATSPTDFDDFTPEGMSTP